MALIFGSFGTFEVDDITGKPVGEMPKEYSHIKSVNPLHLVDKVEQIDILLVGYWYEKDGKIEYEEQELAYEEWLKKAHVSNPRMEVVAL